MTDVLRPDRSAARPVVNDRIFEGDVAIQGPPGPGHDLELAAVFFSAGARTLPHIHSTDQILVAVDGRCVVVDDHGAVEIGVGETAIVTRGEWHWHGAAAGGSGAHLTIRIPGPTDWDQPRKDYDTAPASDT